MFGLLALVGEPTATRAELVVLVEGGVIKVEEFRRQGDRVLLLLPSGGRLELPLIRIERVVEDEIEPENERVDPSARLGIDLDYRAGQGIPQTPFGELIHELAMVHGINPRFVAAVVAAESAFDPHAVSPKGASGLLQLMPATAERFGLPVSEIFEPRKNLDAGIRYLLWLSERFDGNPTLVLAGYNAGEVNVDRHGGVPPFRETQNYIRRVFSAFGVEISETSAE